MTMKSEENTEIQKAPEKEKEDDRKCKFVHAQVAIDGGFNTSRCTIAWRSRQRMPDNSEDVEVAIAWCSPRDHFARKRGREISERRLENNPIIVHVVDDGCDKCNRKSSNFSHRLILAVSEASALSEFNYAEVLPKHKEMRQALRVPQWAWSIWHS